MKFIHLTDTHIVPEGQLLYGQDPALVLQAAVAHINHHHPDAAFVVITGDLTERGERAAYAYLRKTLASLTPPCHLVIGNHDRHDHFFEIFKQAPQTDSGHLQYIVYHEHCTCIMLDTVKPGEPGGELCSTRLDWLADMLERHADDDIFLFMHHPPMDVGIGSMDRLGLSGRDALAKVLKHTGIFAICSAGTSIAPCRLFGKASLLPASAAPAIRWTCSYHRKRRRWRTLNHPLIRWC